MNPIMELPELRKAERTTLYYREGGSDKVYMAGIEQQGEGFVVNFAYGRQGSALQTGTKTSQPVEYDTAWAICDKLVREKKAKGYTEGPDGTPYQHSEKQQQVSGLLPQLLNPIEEREVSRLVSDPAWLMQQKMDGQRVLLRKRQGIVEGINRKGLVIGLASPIVKGALELPGDFILDGECVGDVLYVFDLLEWQGEDYRRQGFRDRYVALVNLMSQGQPAHIDLVPAYANPQDKLFWLKSWQEEKAEGVVFKHEEAPYVPGRPNSGGTQLKYKFYATGSFIVAQINRQRSIGLRLFDKAGLCGNVTIPPNQRVPRVGSIVDVRFLYAFRESGCLFQPTYLGERDDLEPTACTVSQLKYKATEDDEP